MCLWRSLVNLMLIAMLYFFTMACFAESSQTINWQTFHSPPSTIKEGKYSEQGFVDIALQRVIARLPQYSHVSQMTSLSRALDNIRQQKNTCHPSLYITDERRKLAYFSHLSIISPSNRLIVTTDSKTKWQLASPVDLTGVLGQSAIGFAVVQGRSYGPVIDSALKRLDPQRLTTVSTERLATLFKLVESGRVQITFSYPFELSFFNQQSGSNNQPLNELEIHGIEPYALGSIACAKTEFGKQVISEINQVLEDIRSTRDYFEAITVWWESERDKPAFQAYYQDVFVPSKVVN